MSEWIERMRRVEPARVRAVWASLAALLAALGVTVSADVDGAVRAGIVAFFAVLPLLQGEATRARVSPASDELEVPAGEGNHLDGFEVGE